MKLSLYKMSVLIFLMIPVGIYTRAFLNAESLNLPMPTDFAVINILLIVWSHLLAAILCLKSLDFNNGSFPKIMSQWIGWPMLIIMFMVSLLFNATMDGFFFALFQVMTSFMISDWVDAGWISLEHSYYAPQLILPFWLMGIFGIQGFLAYLLSRHEYIN